MKVNYLKSVNYIIYIMILIPIFTQAKGLLANLSGDIGLEYDGFESFSNFLTDVRFDTYFEETTISSKT